MFRLKVNPRFAAPFARRPGAALLLALIQLPAWADTPATGDAQADTHLETVTVSARRREENAQDIPTPMTTLSGQALENQRLYRLQDLQQALPSVNIAYSQSRVSNIAVRGIGNNQVGEGLEGSTGLYIDNVYLSRPGMASFDLLDLDQIELLRGPQGTLFGKNTTAGVLNISTRAPTFTPERSLEVSGGEYGYAQTKGTVSGPLTDTLAGRVSFYRTRDDGYVDNQHDGRSFNGGEREGLRGQLLFQPDDDFSLRWITDYNQEKSTNGVLTLYGASDRFRQRATLIGANPDYARDGNVNIDSPQSLAVFQGGSSLEANWNLDGGYRLTSITAYRYWHFLPHNDADLTDQPAILDSGTEVTTRQYSQEIRLASPVGETFDYVLGAYLYRQDTGNRNFADYGPDADLFLTGVNRDIYNNVSTQTNGKVTTDSYALFAQGNWHLTDRLDLTAGIRGTYEEKTADVHRFDPTGGATLSTALQASRQAQMGGYQSGEFGLHSASPSGLLSLSYHLSDNLMTYASLAHGEKSGGINLAVPSSGMDSDSLVIGPERLNDAEVGFKSTWFDRSLLVNANLFWMGVNGYQASTRVITAASATPVTVLANAGTVRSRGAELDLTWLPVRGLTLNLNGSYNDTTYLSFKNAPCPGEVSTVNAAATCDLSGHAVVGASKWIANASGHYQWNLANGLQPYANLSYSYRSAAEGTLDNSALSKIDAYGLVNASTGVRFDVGDGQADVSLWVRNLTDKDYYLTASAVSNGAYSGSIGSPRTAGVTLRYDF
ncbi:TonB-dependent receptor [Pseudomonas eucalypticola]|uniref:TonB-dependent receptor n=2 Tax=Pseudomonas TaxID=286 RepID=A0A7D5H1F6_9PSED|nr:TonB-dependent receptor [Pseudomonas eucalypticola]